MTYEGGRPHATLSAQKHLRTGRPAAIEAYIAERNATRIDGWRRSIPRGGNWRSDA